MWDLFEMVKYGLRPRFTAQGCSQLESRFAAVNWVYGCELSLQPWSGLRLWTGLQSLEDLKVFLVKIWRVEGLILMIWMFLGGSWEYFERIFGWKRWDMWENLYTSWVCSRRWILGGKRVRGPRFYGRKRLARRFLLNFRRNLDLSSVFGSEKLYNL